MINVSLTKEVCGEEGIIPLNRERPHDIKMLVNTEELGLVLKAEHEQLWTPNLHTQLLVRWVHAHGQLDAQLALCTQFTRSQSLH